MSRIWPFSGLVLALWGFLAPSLLAQSPEREQNTIVEAAVVVTTSGDSIEGQIEQLHTSTTPQHIRFRRSPDAPFRTYGPTDLQSVQMGDGLRLVSRAVDVYQVPEAPSAARTYLQSEKPRTAKDTLILEVLVDGPLTLYTKQGSRDRFYLESDDKIVELIERRWLEETRRGTTELLVKPWHRQQLPIFMNGCSNAQQQIPTSTRTIPSLSKVILRYNRCTTQGRAIPLFSLLDLSVGLEVGAFRHRIPSIASAWKQGYEAGVSMKVLHTRGTFNWAVYSSLGVAQQPVNLTARTLDQTFVHATFLGQYYFSQWAVQPYIEMGPTFVYKVKGEPSGNKYLRDDSQFKMGALAGLGLQSGPVFIGVRGQLRESYLGATTAMTQFVVAGVQFDL